jgi:DNA-binding transcriptional ArsR family regulator
MDANIALPAALIGDPTRAAILLALFDGRAQPASALAYAAHVSAQAASNHLAKLSDGGLLAVEAQGRHRYYRLAAPEIATALEALANVATHLRPIREPLTRKGRALRFARSCYDHLAGQLGVAITEALENRGLIAAPGASSRLYDVTPSGHRWFADLGIDVEAIHRRRQPLARRCLDWTERRHHLAGMVGSALFARLETLDWLLRDRETRVVRLTELGGHKLRETFGIDAWALMDSRLP